MGDVSSFAFTISLAAVINGLGLVRLMSALAGYVQSHAKARIRHYWVYELLLGLQFLMHVLLWWAMFGTRAAGPLNFVQYLYLLVGPILLFLGTSVLLPDLDEAVTDLRELYALVARPFYTVAALLWLWGIFLWPMLVGVFTPSLPLFFAFLFVALLLRFTPPGKAHAVLVPVYGVLIVVFIALYQLQLGRTARALVEGVQ